MKISAILMIAISLLLIVLVIYEPFFFFVVAPMLILGWLGWFVGQKFEKKYPEKRWLSWVSLGIGLLGLFIGLLIFE